MIGKTISHYKLIEEIGSGGMGVVYKAKDTKLKRTVALKFLPSEITRDKDAKTRFIHEAQAAAALNHPNIVTIHEINEHDNKTYIAMEFVEGKTLKDLISDAGARGTSPEERGANGGSPLPLEQALDIAGQAAEGLKEAHEKKIIHRDIKSANIMVTDKGQVKILDFGLAKLRGQTKLTRESTTLGTVAYMSPEQTTGDVVDQRSDIWSLGVVFYEMLTGKLPFPGHYEQAIVYSILNEPPTPPAQLVADLPPDLEQILNKMLAKSPTDRYQNLNEFLNDIERFKKGKDLKPEYKIAPSPLSLGLGFLVLIAVIIASYFIFKGGKASDISSAGPESMPSLAVVYFENKSGDENLDNWRDAFAELLTTDLSQSKYLKVLRSDEVYGIFEKLNLLETRRYSTEDLRKIAENGRVDHILRGSYFKDQDNFVITTMLLNVDTGETISSLSVRAKGGEIFSNVDDITRDIKLRLNLSEEQISGDIDKNVGAITTSSPKALHYYMQGRRSFKAGKYRESATFMEKAIEIDPEFAMAYRSMAWSYGMLWEVSKGRDYMTKAMKFGHRLSDRQRYIIEGDFYRWGPEKTLHKAVEALKKVLELYPYDVNANVSAALAYQDLGKWDKMIERYEAALWNKPDSSGLYGNMGNSYAFQGDYEKARKTLEYFIDHFRDHWYIRSSLALNFYFQRKFDLALIEIDRAISQAPKNYRPYHRKGNIYLYQGDFSRAEKAFAGLLEFKEPIARLEAIESIGAVYLTQGRLADAEKQFKQALKLAQEKIKARQDRSHSYLGNIYFISKKYEECLNEFNKLLALNKDWPVGQSMGLYFTAVCHLEMESSELAQKAEAELLEWANNRAKKTLIRWYYLFLGKKELAQNNFSSAIEHFNKALSLLGRVIHTRDQPLILDPLARAYLESGEVELAQNVYEKITTLTHGRWLDGHIYARAFYQLGKIHDREGRKEEALKNYNQFIELWKNCDPIFQPLVEDARARVAELEDETEE